VNLSNFIYDTQDLSTIRGGGLLLLDVAEKVSKYLQEKGCKVQPAVHGASTGLFEIEATGPHAALVGQLLLISGLGLYRRRSRLQLCSKPRFVSVGLKGHERQRHLRG
jgi:hypothetical protein